VADGVGTGAESSDVHLRSTISSIFSRTFDW
jgi:hypothetical protein